MVMSENEIKRDYNAAKDKEAQIGILADLNLCSKEEIKRIVEGKGELLQSLFEELDQVEAEAKRLEEWYKKLAIAIEVISVIQERDSKNTEKTRKKGGK